MIDGWVYKDFMVEYLTKKYVYVVIKSSKRVKDNLMIFLCYLVPDGEISRHQFTVNEMQNILREYKLKRIVE